MPCCGCMHCALWRGCLVQGLGFRVSGTLNPTLVLVLLHHICRCTAHHLWDSCKVLVAAQLQHSIGHGAVHC
jgi:hypothetical protein